MKTRFCMDPETGAPHVERHGVTEQVERHGVTEQEVREVLTRAFEDRPGRDGSRVALGQTSEGRYLRVVYVPDPEPGSVFVITAYQLGPKAKRALRRRRRKKP